MGNAKIVGAKFRIIVGGNATTIPVSQVTVTRAKGEPLKWSVVIPGKDASYFNNFTKPELQPVGSPSKFAELEIFSSGGSRTYTDLILLDRRYEANPEGGYTITLSGADFSQVLFRDNQTMQTFEKITAHNIIQAILSNYGFSSYELNFPDFPVMQMDFQRDRPINRIQTLLNEVGAFWRVEGKRFITWIPSVRNRADFHYKDNEDIYLVNLNEQVMNLVNKVTVCRVTKNAFRAFMQEGDSTGRMTGKFSGVFVGVDYRIHSDIGCIFYDVDYFRNGQWVGHQRPQMQSANHPQYGNPETSSGQADEVDEVAFTVAPSPQATSYNWKIEFTGMPIEYIGTRIDPNASYTYADNASISAYGELPAPNIESNFTPSNAIAQMKAEAFMREQGSLKRSIEFEAVINPYLELDETIRITEKVSGVDGYFNVESVTTTINGAEGTDSLQVVEYER